MRPELRNGIAAALTLAIGMGAGTARADGVTDGNQGREALLAGNLDEAIRLFGRALKDGGMTAKNQAVTLNLRANAYMEKGQTEVALEDANESLRLTETPDAHFTRAKIFVAQMHFDDAVQELNRTLQMGSQAADVWAMRGHAQVYAGRPQDGLKDLDQALKLAPDYGFALRTRGHAFLNLNQDDKAIADETRAIAVDPKDVEARWLRAYAWRYRKKLPLKAIADYSDALRVAPTDSAARTSRAETYEQLGRFGEAAADYDVAIRQNPRGPAGYLGRGRLNLAQGKAGAAGADLAKAVGLKPADGYAVLWLHLARGKEGADDAVEFKANAARVDRGQWPGPVLDYFGGKLDALTLLTMASEGERKNRQLCETNLFLGQDDLAQRRRAQGLERMQAAAQVCDAASPEARLIRTDLKRAATPDKPVLTQAADRSTSSRSKGLVQAQNEAQDEIPGLPSAALRRKPHAHPRPAPRKDVDPLLRGSLK